jgi:AcrR family transcriptional regulator
MNTSLKALPQAALRQKARRFIMEDTIILHRDDPDKDPLVGHVKVTREDWINVARHILINEGINQVKVLTISDRLGVSRSSFYWYFENRKDLLDGLLKEWEQRNTSTIQKNCEMPATSINMAVCNFFRCFINPELFDRGLDFAVREWSRRNKDLRERLDEADSLRINAVTAMFSRYGYNPTTAGARARILYYMQLGYHALDVTESMEERIDRLAPYLEGFTGETPTHEEVAEVIAYARAIADKNGE